VPDINYRRYRHVQTMHMLQERYVTGNATDEQLAALKSALRPWERVVYGFIEHAAYRSGRRLAAAAKNLVFHTWRLLGRHFTATPTTYLPWFAEKIEGRYADAIEVFKGVDPDDPAWLS
jgi:hypothetical protein